MLDFKDYMSQVQQKNLADCSNEEIYVALLNYTKEFSAELPYNDAKFFPAATNSSLTVSYKPRLIKLLDKSFPIKNSAEM